MNLHARNCGTLVFVALTLALAGQAQAVVTHNEATNGDLSGDGANPTTYTLQPGVNSIIATSVSGDREYLRTDIPAGLQLSQLILSTYAGVDGAAFIAVQEGPTFTENPSSPVVGNLLGWSHFGPNYGHVGTDILDDVSNGSGAIGFDPPLPAGTYTWWIQQTGGSPSTYQLDYTVVPEPAAASILVLAAACILRRGNR